MTIEDFVGLIKQVREDFQREEEQGLLQRDLEKSVAALAGKYACDRILRRIEARSGVRVIEPGKMGRAR